MRIYSVVGTHFVAFARLRLMSMMTSAISFQELGREACNLADGDNMIYVAVAPDISKSWSYLSWVARNFAGQKICFLHVLQPTKIIPSKYEPRISEKQRIQEILKDYHRILSYTGLEGGGDVYIKLQNIEEGIVMLMSRLKIKNLVMGAVAPTKETVYFRSKRMIYMSGHAPASSQIWFVHGGHLIMTRYEQMITGGSSRKETYQESLRREKAEKESAAAACKREELQLMQESKNVIIGEALALDSSDMPGSSSSQSSSTELPSFVASFSPSAPPLADLSHGQEESNDEILMQATARPKETLSNPSSPLNVLNEGAVYDDLYERLEKAMAEIERLRREGFEESSRHREAERDAVGASRRAKAAEINMNSQLVALLGQKSLLEDEIADFKKDNKELTERIALSVELMKRYTNERDEFKAELDRALRATAEMKHSAESSSSRSSGSSSPLLSEFSYSEIQDATNHFDHSLKTDEQGFWRIYKGVLHHTEVDIKLLDADSPKSLSEYQQEVEALSRLRHPYIVTLIGACPEALAIIYEHFPNGSLEDRLSCKNNSSPLPWQTRICIAAELCSVLVFLHSTKPHCIVHGDLKPANIFLDSNFNVKLSHFRLFPKSDINRTTQRVGDSASRRTKPSDTFVRMDLESDKTTEYTPEIDVYLFGVILLRLLTGREAWGVKKEVQVALGNGKFDMLLDCLAGDWPYVQAEQLAKIALRCSDVSWQNRPDLESQVLGVLQKMKASCQGSLMGSRLGGKSHSDAPNYYICPISQDVMQDPHVAADGHTYEKEGIQGWLNSGHDTSPMTNLKLAHTKLVPNRALRSAIQEWKQRL